MKKENMGDMVFDGIAERAGMVVSEMNKRFKNTKPFRQPEITDKDLIYSFYNLQPEEIAMLTAKHGLSKFTEFMKEMREKRERYARR